MSVVAAYHYRDGKRIGDISIDEPTPCGDDPSEFVWIGLLEPSDEELMTLQDRFGLHPLAVEDALKAHQLPKVDVYGDQLFVIARTAHRDDDKIAYGETAIFVGRSHIITVRHGSARAHSDLRVHLEASPALLKLGVDYVLHAIIDFIVDGYQPIVEAIEEEVLQTEQQAMNESLEKEETARLFAQRREVIRFQRIIGPMGEVANKLANLDMPCIDKEARPYFRDVLDHVRRVDNMVGGLRDALTSVFEVSALLEQQRQGAITRQLAAWAAILAVPTAIAGIYGMNFDHMPELRLRYGYPAVITVIFILCTSLYIRFKRVRWL
ncbi:magnesium/cobalt transporter CorA [Sphingomonas hylomeconis]|uniref:Magnesium transport protein CorA n=1 Tax=Sphingomonas hylomeconis TaxID=1395958 RepID=A0ABV7SZG6_9SPHN|nr:magnesium/cobalt transporter CorA [Sphingomonas hylomeconis]